MSVNEFELIARYFTGQQAEASGLVLGIGDDAAVLECPSDQQLVVTTDTLNAGIHFPKDTDAADIARKALSVNLSDIAAMGARPAFFTLSLCLPDADETWLQAFSRGLFEVATGSQVCLVGGDTTRGPLSVSITLFGYVSPGQAISRAHAQPGDCVYVSGTMGDAAIGLRIIGSDLTMEAEHRAYFIGRLNCPTPKTTLGQMLVGRASAMIDVSDGLLADIGKLIKSSHVGAAINVDQVPTSAYADSYFNQNTLLQLALTGGDDYELCFTIAPELEQDLLQQVGQLHIPVTKIGYITAGSDLSCKHADGQIYAAQGSGYDHFV